MWQMTTKTLFYTKRDPETLRAYAVYRHVLGTNADQDELVYEERDSTFYCHAYKTKSDQYIVIGCGHTLTSEYRILRASDPFGSFQIFEPRDLKNEHEYDIAHYNDHMVCSNKLGCQNLQTHEKPAPPTLLKTTGKK